MPITQTAFCRCKETESQHSVPSRLIGHRVRVRLYERRIEVFVAQRKQLEIERLVGRNGHRINYRHVIWSLVRKPGAFARHRYREDFFPTLVFRRAYDALTADGASTERDLAYLRILFVAAATSETDVETALGLLLDERRLPDADVIKELVGHDENRPKAPSLDVPVVDLGSYDALLSAGGLS